MGNMKSAMNLAWRRLPTALAIAALGSVILIGVGTNWRIPSAAAVFGAESEPEPEWCLDHGTSEATCVICRGFKITATPPSKRAQTEASSNDGESVIEEPHFDGAPRPIVQVPSAAALLVAGVVTGVAETRPIAEAIEANAESGYDMTRYAQVAPRAPGSVVVVRAHAGQRVGKNEVLALISAAEVGRAKAEFLQAAAQLASRRAVLERLKASTAAGFRNQTELQTAEAEVREAQIRASSARQAIGNLGLPTASLNPDDPPTDQAMRFLGIPSDVVAMLDETTATSNLLPVIAPLDGVIISQNVAAGEIVETTRPLFVVSDTSRLWVTAEVPVKDVPQIAVGQAMSFIPDGWTGEAFGGKVAWISTEVSEKTRLVQVRAELANPNGQLLAHMFGRARIEIRSVKEALVVPESAVQRDGEASLVFVQLNEEVFRPREVELGARVDGYVEVKSGLGAGEIIATRGSYILASQANRGKLGAGCCGHE